MDDDPVARLAAAVAEVLNLDPGRSRIYEWAVDGSRILLRYEGGLSEIEVEPGRIGIRFPLIEAETGATVFAVDEREPIMDVVSLDPLDFAAAILTRKLELAGWVGDVPVYEARAGSIFRGMGGALFSSIGIFVAWPRSGKIEGPAIVGNPASVMLGRCRIGTSEGDPAFADEEGLFTIKSSLRAVSPVRWGISATEAIADRRTRATSLVRGDEKFAESWRDLASLRDGAVRADVAVGETGIAYYVASFGDVAAMGAWRFETDKVRAVSPPSPVRAAWPPLPLWDEAISLLDAGSLGIVVGGPRPTLWASERGSALELPEAIAGSYVVDADTLPVTACGVWSEPAAGAWSPTMTGSYVPPPLSWAAVASARAPAKLMIWAGRLDALYWTGVAVGDSAVGTPGFAHAVGRDPGSAAAELERALGWSGLSEAAGASALEVAAFLLGVS